MSIEVLNTKVALIVFGVVVALPAAAYGVYRGVEFGIHAHHTALLHTAQNLTYSLEDCTVSPSQGGTRWSANVLVHNGNPDSVGQYGVQVEFLDATRKPVAWTRVNKIPPVDSGGTRNMAIAEDVNQGASQSVTCEAVFFYKGHPAKDLSPRKIGEGQ